MTFSKKNMRFKFGELCAFGFRISPCAEARKNQEMHMIQQKVELTCIACMHTVYSHVHLKKEHCIHQISCPMSKDYALDETIKKNK